MTETPKSAPAAPIANQVPAQAMILVVENIPHMGNILCGMVRELGYPNVHRVSNIVSAFRFILDRKPKLVIGEARMKPCGAIHLCQALRLAADSPARDLPVLITVSAPTVELIVAARDCGANHILSKPFSKANLEPRLTALLRRPIPFVSVRSYTGPDRRRQTGLAPTGIDRRRGEPDRPDYTRSAASIFGIEPAVLTGAAPIPEAYSHTDSQRLVPLTVPAAGISRKISIRELRPGMQLAEAVRVGAEMVVAPRNLVVSEETLDRLRRLAAEQKIAPTVAILG